ncbi:uncharacterized protein LOC144922534 [Branchiostoma floridae x Branchiostoma belcheri]
MQCLGVVVLTTVLVATAAAVQPSHHLMLPGTDADSERAIGTGHHPIIQKINPLQGNIENALLLGWKGPEEDAPVYSEDPAVYSEGAKSLCQLKELIDGDEEEGTVTKRGPIPMQALVSGRFGRSGLHKKVPLAALSAGRFGRSPQKVPLGALTAGRFGRSEVQSRGIPVDALMAGRFGRSTGLPKLTLEALVPGRFGRSAGPSKKVPLEALAAGRFGRSGSPTKKVPLAALAVGRFGRDEEMVPPRQLRSPGTVSLRMPLAALATGRFGRSAPTDDDSGTSEEDLEVRSNSREEEEEIEVASEDDGGHPELQKAPEPNQHLPLSTIPRMKSPVSRRRFDFSKYKIPLAALKTGRFKRHREGLGDQHDGIPPTNTPSLKESYGSDSTVRYSPSMALSTANHDQPTDQQNDYV